MLKPNRPKEVVKRTSGHCTVCCQGLWPSHGPNQSTIFIKCSPKLPVELCTHCKHHNVHLVLLEKGNKQLLAWPTFSLAKICQPLRLQRDIQRPYYGLLDHTAFLQRIMLLLSLLRLDFKKKDKKTCSDQFQFSVPSMCQFIHQHHLFQPFFWSIKMSLAKQNTRQNKRD